MELLYFGVVSLGWTGISFLRSSPPKRKSNVEILQTLLYDIGADRRHWEYKAEGGANVAFGYVGPCPSLKGQLLRLKKVRKEGNRSNIPTCRQLLPHDPLEYAHKVMKPLIGEGYVVPGLEIRVDSAYLWQWAKRLEREERRPKSRASQPLDLAFGAVVLMVDHTYLIEPWEPAPQSRQALGPPICVELKPKSGVPDSAVLQSKTCRFCMHQVHKLMESCSFVPKTACEKAPTKVSRYCAAALYDLQRDSVLQVLNGVVQTPQNNFRLFLGGSLCANGVKGEGNPGPACCGQQFCGQIKKSQVVPGMPETCWKDRVVATLAEILLRDPVLKKVQAVQSLDTLGVEKAVVLYKRLHEEASGRKDVACAEELATSSLPSQSLQQLREFFISTTAKDCSVMITFQLFASASASTRTMQKMERNKYYPIESGHLGDEHLRRNRGSFLFEGAIVDYSVAVVDLDPKPFERLPRYHALDADITTTFRTCGKDIMEAAGKRCFRWTTAHGEDWVVEQPGNWRKV